MSYSSAATRSEKARAAIAGFEEALLSHGCDTTLIFDAVAADPECALAQAYAAALFLTRMTREGRIQAAPRLAAAEQLLSGGAQYERLIVSAIGAWQEGRDRDAARLFADAVVERPAELTAAKFAQILQLGVGDTAAMVRTGAMAAAAAPESGHGYGLFAFALEQAGELERAEDYARRAIDRNPVTDPWAQHALAHVLAAREDWSHGRAFLRAHAASWDRCSSFMRTHNWWHAALFALALNRRDEALALFDTQVWGARKAHAQDQANAISLLIRLELEGIDAGSRWADIALHAAARAEDGVSPFLDLHYLYALARAGRDMQADALVAALAGSPDSGVAAPMAQAMVHHARGAWHQAALAFGQARRRWRGLGGSQIQRELFERLFVDSLMRAGRERRRYA